MAKEGMAMKKCCCFCGEEIKEFPQYVLSIQKYKRQDVPGDASQHLFCHEQCLEKRLFDDKWLYIKYI